MILPSSNSQQIPLFRDLSSAQISNLLYGYEQKTLNYGQYLFEQGAQAFHFAIILSGCLKVVKSRQHKQVLLTLLSEGNLAAAMIMGDDDPRYPADVVSIASSSILLVPQSTYREFWLTNPLVVQRVQQLFHRRCDTFHFDRSLQQDSVEQRVAGFLMYNLALNSKDHHTFNFKLTRKDIAHAVGAEIESVIRVMSKFEKGGVLKTTQSQIEILQPTTLSRFLSDEPKSSNKPFVGEE